MTQAQYDFVMYRSLLGAVCAGLPLFFLARYVLQRNFKPVIRLLVILPSLLLFCLIAGLLTHDLHISLITGSGGSIGLSFGIVAEANRREREAHDLPPNGDRFD